MTHQLCSRPGRDDESASCACPQGALEPRTFARRLNELFEQWDATHGRHLTTTALAAVLGTRGHPISVAYLSQLRRGRRTNPSPELLRHLAVYFDVELDGLVRACAGSGGGCVSDDSAIDRIQDPVLRRLCRVTSGVSTESVDLLCALADRLRLAEGLPPHPETARW
ncbi:helix-turn-helix domain-containing protein [Nocardia brasiliensis]|uniref:helix-turn-helix domain-containing protein n=1 Tax=Nocardia brasiliensis TaxID=37326 RepID=UPI003D8BAB59